MKLVRYGAVGHEKPGLIDSKGRIRDLSAHIADIDGATISPASLAKLKALDADKLPLVAEGTRLGGCVARPQQFIAVGLNYVDHAIESGQPVPAEPVLFNKTPNCIIGANDNVMVPKGSTKLDWEVELAIVIGSRTRYVEKDQALAHVAGYAVCHDVSERQFQIERTGQWMKGKGCETFGPLGPYLVTADDIADVQALGMWLDVNGKRMQTGNTKTMIFDVATIVSYISQFMVLEAGDVITTGTPPGVGMGMKPPQYLKAGDVVTLGIDGLGEQKQTVVPFKM